MDIPKKIKLVGLGVVVLTTLNSCKEGGRSEILHFARTIKSNSCKIYEIQWGTESHWIATLHEVENLLPCDIPIKERETLLSLKNASMLRKVDSYDRLGDDIHGKIDAMEVYDAIMADSIRILNFQNQELKMEMEKLLGDIRSKDALEKVRTKVHSIQSRECI
ncbi:hypothetical protein [Membranihabitans maritimus]|uniref:hypothetical protein n=1 Tax=Membranihabitans maritimus TaxID=2904244 RepID=UPI001F21B57E|nr:hypothetical protein [Membranihabitans maritimus]